VLPRARRLICDGEPVELSSRAFDILTVLIEASGTLVSKEEIMRRVWPSTTVDDSNLRVQMAALRAVLGEDRVLIKTVPGRGYVFAVDVVSESNNSKAWVRDPALPGPADMPDAIRASSSSARDAMLGVDGQPAIVVIDDDRDIREALADVLQSVGLRVEAFDSVRQFLDSGRPERAGCLVLDVRLPGQSGLDFYDDLIRTDLHLPVVFISGHADVPMSVRAMKAGAVEFLTKPVRHQDLLDAIQLAMGSATPARPQSAGLSAGSARRGR